MATVITVENLVSALITRPGDKRAIIAIAGAPGSGKSTLADEILTRINDVNPKRATVLPMDGFHYDDAVLHALKRHNRKGAPDTFDVDGLENILARLRKNTRATVAVPVFDRRIELARASARLIPDTCNIVLVEGNYLLLDTPPWNALSQYFDVTVMIQTPTDVLRQRLTQRWEKHGIPAAEIQLKIEGNDLPNGDIVMTHSRQADYSIET